MYSEFLSTLSGILPIDNQVCDQFLQKLKFANVKKGKLLLSEGEICDKLWFVKIGLVRGYLLTSNQQGTFDDNTEWFAKENEFFHAADSFVNQVPACECIETLEPTTLIYIHRADLYQLYLDYPQICCLGRIIAERSWLKHLALLRDMRALSAAQKLEAFHAVSKELTSRVPQKYIASYLGISENYVSKLRANY
ncbi:Crp/Fnr family transcriptional regulator [Dyadobacter aurulentus]|uniref:Crp/Fnr family transcriptional regulator n=1 Tax=Dyadobacter sp. UC 10 TaxID=2605428 RepID=UPI0011F0F525|nr:Crp/Fnr family transcriptional regulator [Dyadobacter sp. UC 10]KAA0991514.1 Crp/Fnr family transcriptional regulator [Dyadobacter sp. UC 10]